MSQPAWDSVDNYTADLLTLVATDAMTPTPAEEWSLFTDAVARAAHGHGGKVDQNHVRPLIRGHIAPKRIGAFWRRACLDGLLVVDGYSISDDHEGRNAGRPMRCYRLADPSP